MPIRSNGHHAVRGRGHLEPVRLRRRRRRVEPLRRVVGREGQPGERAPRRLVERGVRVRRRTARRGRPARSASPAPGRARPGPRRRGPPRGGASRGESGSWPPLSQQVATLRRDVSVMPGRGVRPPLRWEHAPPRGRRHSSPGYPASQHPDAGAGRRVRPRRRRHPRGLPHRQSAAAAARRRRGGLGVRPRDLRGGPARHRPGGRGRPRGRAPPGLRGRARPRGGRPAGVRAGARERAAPRGRGRDARPSSTRCAGTSRRWPASATRSPASPSCAATSRRSPRCGTRWRASRRSGTTSPP